MFLGILTTVSAWRWLQHLGGIGLVALGIADASLVPIPGSIDALTIVLAASNRDWWPYYALMATVGSVCGGYATYRIGRKGGKEALDKKFSKKTVDKVYAKFEKGGFGAVLVPALLPPPVPMVPFVLAAGAMNYSTKKFLTALTIGRSIRFFGLAFLASIYGRQILGFMQRYYKPVLWSFVVLVVLASLFSVIYFLRRKRSASSAPPAVRNDAAA